MRGQKLLEYLVYLLFGEMPNLNLIPLYSFMQPYLTVINLAYYECLDTDFKFFTSYLFTFDSFYEFSCFHFKYFVLSLC